MKQPIHEGWSLTGVLSGYSPLIPGYGNWTHHAYTDTIPATVPGGVHYDLFRAGIIENPYVDMNSLACEWTENRWWLYKTQVTLEKKQAKKKYLVFEGLDYLCEIFINGKSFGEHENMFTEMRIDIGHIEDESFELIVLFKGVPRENGQQGRTSDTFTQKSRFGYKWDFATRLVNIGIWQDVYVEYVTDARITEKHLKTDVADGTGIISATISFEEIAPVPVTFTLLSPEGCKIHESTIPMESRISKEIRVENPALWYPNGYGEQPLYTLEIRFGEECERHSLGIRSLRYTQNPGAPADSLTYTAVINGKRIYLKGNNKVPLDHLYGNVSDEAYEWCVRALKNENVNLVRVWGGGIIETERFYNLCDRYGILVWQDFIQSSSVVDDVPSKRPEFLEKIGDAATAAVKRCRNHTSLLLWTGGNELREFGIPVTYEDKNIHLLKSIVDTYDHEHIFLPSTPNGPVYVIDFDREDNHDVHAPWEYNVHTHYEKFNRLKLLFHSEFGTDGMTASAPLFLTESKHNSEKFNGNRHHGEYWWHGDYAGYARDVKLFGEFESSAEYTPYSQWIQAESLRYIIETERRLAPYASGSMVWQINEPWPNTTCTNLMDYFGTPKMAYYWCKKAFSDMRISLRCPGVIIPKEGLSATVCKRGDAEGNASCKAEIFSTEGKLLYKKEFSSSDLPITVEIPYVGENKMLFVRLCEGEECKDYFFTTNADQPYAPARVFKKATLDCKFDVQGEENDILHMKATVRNTAGVPAFFVAPADQTLGHAILASDAFFTLLPGEEKEISLTVRKRRGLFFDAPTEAINLCFKALNVNID